LRRRGYTPESIRLFAEKIGVAKADSVVDITLLEHCIRDDMNRRASRVMAVLRPLKMVIENYPDGQVEMMEALNNPEDPDAGNRQIPFSKEVYIERDDFMENPPKKYFRLSPGAEVRLKHAYYVTCTDVIKDENGEITEIRCKYDPESRGGGTPDNRRVLGTLHWVSVPHAVDAEIRLYDHLFIKPNPEEDPDFRVNINPESVEILKGCKVEPGLKTAKVGDFFQFLRQGYFCVDRIDSSEDHPVFNRTTGLKDSWAKIAKKGK
jgi:glutaminyl-tRNA synthetase